MFWVHIKLVSLEFFYFDLNSDAIHKDLSVLRAMCVEILLKSLIVLFLTNWMGFALRHDFSSFDALRQPNPLIVLFTSHLAPHYCLQVSQKLYGCSSLQMVRAWSVQQRHERPCPFWLSVLQSCQIRCHHLVTLGT